MSGKQTAVLVEAMAVGGSVTTRLPKYTRDQFLVHALQRTMRKSSKETTFQLLISPVRAFHSTLNKCPTYRAILVYQDYRVVELNHSKSCCEQ